MIYRKATRADLPAVIAMLLEDELGQTREQLGKTLDPRYEAAFEKMDADPNQYLMVVEFEGRLIGTCQLTLIPGLSFMGSTRLQIESVRVAAAHRSQGIGEAMMQEAIEYGKKQGAKIIQLTTNKQRLRAKVFYERLGFVASHEGMKLYL